MANFFKSLGGMVAPLLGTAANMFIPGSGALVSGLLGGLGGSAAPTGMSAPTNVSSTSAWQPQAQALQDLYGRGKSWMDQYGGMTADETAGQKNIMDFYGQGGQGSQMGQEFMGRGRGLADQGYGAATGFLGQNAPQAGIDMNTLAQAANNPYAQQSIDAMAGDVTRNLQRNILPSIRNQAGGRGLVGSTRAGVAEGLASSDATRQIGDLASKYRSDLYNNALGMGGQFGLANAQAQQARQLQQAQLGANLGGAGMDQMGMGLGMSGDALSKYMAGAGMGRDITGGAMDKYKGWLSGGPTTLSNSSSGMVDQGDRTSNIIGGIGKAITGYSDDQKTAEADMLAKYKSLGGGTGVSAYDKWRLKQPSGGMFGGLFG